MAEYSTLERSVEIPATPEAFFKAQEDYFRETDETRQQQAESMFFEGESPTEEELEIAKFLIEEQEDLDYQKSDQWQKLLDRGLITFIPARVDSDQKREVLGLETQDPKTYDLFNQAAKEITGPYQGFPQQVGRKNSGFAGWELWIQKEGAVQKPPQAYQLMKETFQKMREIRTSFR